VAVTNQNSSLASAATRRRRFGRLDVCHVFRAVGRTRCIAARGGFRGHPCAESGAGPEVIAVVNDKLFGDTVINDMMRSGHQPQDCWLIHAVVKRWSSGIPWANSRAR